MEKYQFAFHSEIIGYTSPHIGEVRKAIHRKVEKEKSAAIKNDIELHMYKMHDGIPVLLNTCYLYDEKGCMIHGSIKELRIICLRHGDTIQTDIPKVSVPQESGPARQAGLFRCITLKIRNHEPDITTYRLYSTVCKPLLRGLPG